MKKTISEEEIVKLEQQLKQLQLNQLKLIERVNYLERENNRRKSEVNQIGSYIARK
jgi:hypothetical protein